MGTETADAFICSFCALRESTSCLSISSPSPVAMLPVHSQETDKSNLPLPCPAQAVLFPCNPPGKLTHPPTQLELRVCSAAWHRYL